MFCAEGGKKDTCQVKGGDGSRLKEKGKGWTERTGRDRRR